MSMKSKKIHILLVEDEEDHSKIIRDSFESKANQVIIDVVQTLREANAYLSKSTPDLMLVDCHLPDGEGIKLLPDDKKTQSYPVIIMTSHGDEQTAVDAIKAGALDYIVKSESTLFEMPHLCEKAIREWGYIVERNRAEEKIRKLFRAVEQSPSSVVITDIEGNIEYVNPKFTQLTGYTSEEAIGQNPRILKSGKTQPDEYIRLWQSIKSGIEWQGEFCNKKKNGELYWEFASISPVKNEEGVVTHFVAVKEDITERKHMEEKLEDLVKERTAEVDRLLFQKDSFINQLSHDLKTPLTPLVALLPMLEDKTNDPEARKILDLVMENVEYMKNLTEMTLQLARLNAPSVQLNFERRDLLSEIQNTIDSFSPVFNERGISVVNNITSPLMADVDGVLIKELLYNLISNAVKYTKSGGVVTLDSFLNDNNVKVSITDTGVGMTSVQIEHIFEEFYKVDDSRNDHSSTGLGLTICQRIIEKHRGSIWAKSSGYGKGTTMNFTLPIIQDKRKGLVHGVENLRYVNT